MSGVTHATIAVAALFGEQENMVLVGHSYAGMIITGVAETMEKSISSFVMLDAFFPETGEAPVDLQPPAVRDGLLAAQRNGGSAIPPRPAATFNINEKDRAWVDAQCTPHPLKCFIEAGTHTGARAHRQKAFIRATNYPSEPFDRGLANARAKGWQVYKVACGHDVMLDEPERLAAILRDRASLHP
jgi:pimeloyl-ACP methyl ester carboxylesterase